MKFILSTGSLYIYSLERCVDFAAQAGFDGIELMVDARWETRQPHFLADLTQRAGLPVLAIHSPFRPVPGWDNSGVPALLAHTVELAEALHAPVVIHHLPTVVDVGILSLWSSRALIPTGFKIQHAYRRWLLNEYTEYQRQTPVTLCIENLPSATFRGKRLNYGIWNSIEGITRFPHICMDTTHLATFGLDLVAVYRRWRHHIRHVHLSNYDGRQHRRPEAGILPLDNLLALMAAEGYDGAISLEMQPDALDAGASDAQVIAHLTGSLATCRSWAASPVKLDTLPLPHNNITRRPEITSTSPVRKIPGP